ncbi:hypothetical protein AAMO2058_000157300 [Amorphochlora amoebiformis]
MIHDQYETNAFLLHKYGGVGRCGALRGGVRRHRRRGLLKDADCGPYVEERRDMKSSKQVDDYKLEGELGSLGKPANEMNLEWTSISDEIDRYARGFDDDTEYEKRVHRRDTMWDQMVDDGNVLDSEESEIQLDEVSKRSEETHTVEEIERAIRFMGFKPPSNTLLRKVPPHLLGRFLDVLPRDKLKKNFTRGRKVPPSMLTADQYFSEENFNAPANTVFKDKTVVSTEPFIPSGDRETKKEPVILDSYDLVHDELQKREENNSHRKYMKKLHRRRRVRNVSDSAEDERRLESEIQEVDVEEKGKAEDESGEVEGMDRVGFEAGDSNAEGLNELDSLANAEVEETRTAFSNLSFYGIPDKGDPIFDLRDENLSSKLKLGRWERVYTHLDKWICERTIQYLAGQPMFSCKMENFKDQSITDWILGTVKREVYRQFPWLFRALDLRDEKQTKEIQESVQETINTMHVHRSEENLPKLDAGQWRILALILVKVQAYYRITTLKKVFNGETEEHVKAIVEAHDFTLDEFNELYTLFHKPND